MLILGIQEGPALVQQGLRRRGTSLPRQTQTVSGPGKREAVRQSLAEQSDKHLESHGRKALWLVERGEELVLLL